MLFFMKSPTLIWKGMSSVEKRKKEKPKFTLTSMQEVAYQRDFKMADRAGGFDQKRSKH